MSHSAEGSVKVIVYALCANFGIAVSKFVGAFITGSASLLAEAIHSLVDCVNQIFLLIGNRKSRKVPDRKHPLGYGRESFFWSFLVALLLVSMGGLFAIYEGIHKLAHPEPISYPWVGLGILVFGVALESFSFWACWKEVRERLEGRGLWKWIQETKSSDLLVIFLEDSAALLGLSVALAALVLGWTTGEPRWDAVGSIVVGIVLVCVAVVLGSEVKSMLIGESAPEEYESEVRRLLGEAFPGGRLLNLIAVQTGADEVSITFKFHPGELGGTARDLIDRMNALEVRIRERFREVRWLFVEPDDRA
jgi:cation diffusion facilitator family transporter